MSETSAIETRPATEWTALPVDQWEFQVRVRRDEHGPEVARVQASAGDCEDALGELWRDECLRKGRPDISMEEIDFRIMPQRQNGVDNGVCDGFLLRARMPFGTIVERQFTKAAFADVALRARQALIQEKVAGSDDAVWYDVTAEPRSAASASEPSLSVETQSRAIDFLSVPFPALVQRARKVGETDGVFPVFYTEDALASCERFSRRGSLYPKPVETGAVEIGPLVSCPETGEFFPVVCAVFEVQDAEEQPLSLSYSSRSWARIQAIVQAMQSQEATRAYRILGQCHGHNFPPAGGAPPCDLCYSQDECHRRSDSASVEDRIWGQAVFSRQPWHLCHLFGVNARKENVQSLFTLKGNLLQRRGFYVIPDFNHGPREGA